LHGEEAPANPRIWELSRFAIQTDPNSRFGFSEVTMESFGEMIYYGRRNGIDRFVTVTTTAFERLLRRAGVVTTRLGEPVQIGIEKAVALYVEVEDTYRAVYEQRLAS
jgi:acyl homoserine lactone synthase